MLGFQVVAMLRFMLLSAMVLPCWAAGGDHGNATTLNKENFDEFLKEQRQSQRAALVMFHVSWCKACQRTFPTFAAASNAVLELEVPVAFAHVECTDDKTLCQRFQVQGYPTIKFFFSDDRAPQNFRGHRSVEGFVRYAQRMTGPAVQQMTGEELQKAMAMETYSAILVSERQADAFSPVARRWMDRHLIAAGLDELPEVSVPEGATLAVYSPAKQQWGRAGPGPPAASFYKGSLDNESAVQEWISLHRFPGIWALGELNFYEFTHSDRSAVLLALDGSGSTSEALEAEIRRAQAQLGEDFVFGAMNGTHWSEELKHFNIQPGELPRVLLSERNFEVWIEDIEQLRATSLTEDLQKLVSGAPLLRQGRTLPSKLFFYKREIWRTLNWAMANRHKPEAVATMVAFIAVLSVILLGLVLIIITCRSGFPEDDERKRK